MPRQKAEPQELPAMTGPGVEQPKFKDIDRAADSLHDLLEERAKISENITSHEKKVAEKMGEHGLTRYVYRDQEVILKPGKTHIKIKTVKASGVDGESAVDITDD